MKGKLDENGKRQLNKISERPLIWTEFLYQALGDQPKIVTHTKVPHHQTKT